MLTLGEQATVDPLGRLSCEKSEQLYVEDALSIGPSGGRSMQSSLCAFFRFCLQQACTDNTLARAVPTLRTCESAKVGSG